MSKEIKELKIPKFLHCENEPKTGDFIHDNRQFIYCAEYLSLIEIVPMNDYLISYPNEQVQKTYYYTSEYFKQKEEFLFVYVQNNVEQINQMKEIEYLQKGIEPISDIELMDQAFEYYLTYLKWEDNNF